LILNSTKSIRRIVLRRATTSALIIFGWSVLPKMAQSSLLRTPPQAEGPFYPIDKPIDKDADLTLVGNHKTRAQGDIHVITGRILTHGGLPIPNALVEIWQANKWGRYQDDRDKSDLPLDDNFQGFGIAQTDKDGRYIFKTVRPAGYSFGGIERTPHIHFKVNAVGVNEFVSQMYFAGEPENKRDIFLNNILQKERVVVAFKPLANGDKIGVFDIILA
jgi:protocatechuate 3,4-dioxygenase, beta subunit